MMWCKADEQKTKERIDAYYKEVIIIIFLLLSDFIG